MYFHEWATQSFQIAKEHAYVGINAEISNDYLLDNVAIAEKQLVLAGNRLAYLLMDLQLENTAINAQPVGFYGTLVVFFSFYAIFAIGYILCKKYYYKGQLSSSVKNVAAEGGENLVDNEI